MNHISNVGTLICTEKGKKTLNIEHIIEALQQMKFEAHIKKLTSELDLSSIENDAKFDEKYEDAMEVKDLINKQKKKSKKRKRAPEFNEELANEQELLFEQAKLNMILTHSKDNLNPDDLSSNNKRMKLEQIEKDLFDSRTLEDEENFD